MKKNIALRLASGLMLSCLLTTCVISGTFAKYVSEGSAEDSARVAKWGVGITVTSEAFKNQYAKDSETEIANTVDAEAKVVAPGTKGTLATVKLDGTPEVAVKVTYKATLDLTGWNVSGDWNGDGDTDDDGETSSYYCPITITIGDQTLYGLDYSTAAEFETAVETEIGKITASYAAKTDLSSKETLAKMEWAWAFEGTDNEQTNAKDTALGNLEEAPTIEFSLTVTVEQVD